MNGLLVDTLAKKPVSRAPVWLMRQAGRYLPEYRAMRKMHSLDALFHTPELACQVTTMPLRRFPVDAAILFSDLLLLLEVWKIRVYYPETGGIFLSSAIEHSAQLFPVTQEQIETTLSYVFTSIAQVLPTLPVPLLGFCGAPFTLLCYLLEGKGQEFSRVLAWMRERPEAFSSMLDTLCDACIVYAKLQKQAGVVAVQFFDSWTHLLSAQEFHRYALPYWRKIQEAMRQAQIPSIFFSKAATKYVQDIQILSPDVMSFDEALPLSWLRSQLSEDILIQGNFSPTFLAERTRQEVYTEARLMADSVKGKQGIIFNLGHGVLPHTPIDNVEAFLEAVTT